MRWARYIVEKARYDEDGNRLVKVRVRSFGNGVKGPAREWPRENLTHVLERGYDVITIPPDTPLEKINGRPVKHLSLNRTGCVRIDSEEASGDFLGDLPDI